MVLMNAHQLEAAEFLDIWSVDELRGIREDGDHLRIGALTTFTEIIRSPPINRYAPALVAAGRTIGAIQIQNRATLGGNVVNGSPAGDSLPVLAAYDASVEIASIRGTRTIPFNEFYSGYRSTVLQPNELVVSLRLPKLTSAERDYFRKVGTRRAQAISKTVLSVRIKTKQDVIESISIAVGSVAPTVIRAKQTEKLLTGATLTGSTIQLARRSVSSEISPITDLRSTEHYRRTVTGNVLGRILSSVAASGRV